MTPAELRKLEDELIARLAAREHIVDWIRYRDVGLEPALHHLLIIDELEKVERGETTRLMLQLPPGSAKSTYTSVEFPPWFIGRNPKSSIIAASHTLDLAERFGRKARNIVASREFKNVFDFGISEDSQAAGKWEATTGAEYFAVGVGGSVTGRRADLGIIDDPVKGREDADSERSRETVWQWYLNDFLTRLKPGARQVLIMCMTGDTPVLMADGTEKPLRHIRPGDEVATYRKGVLSTSYVLNWTNQGSDSIIRIRTSSGRTARANARHPFLVNVDGERRWVKAKDLLPGQEIFRVSGENGKVKFAHRMDAWSRSVAKAIARPTTTRNGGQTESALHPVARILPQESAQSFGFATGSTSTSTSAFSPYKMADVQFAEGPQGNLAIQLIGETCSASTTATKQGSSGGFFATIATNVLAAARHLNSWRPLRRTSRFIPDRIESIEPDGVEDVFDIQVADTENFIANGLVASNTRWHEDDLAGRLLAREASKWRVISLPMIADVEDPLGRKPGDRLWPDWFTEEMVLDAQKDPRSWNALYQQNPVPEEGNFFKKEWFIEYEDSDLPTTLHKYGSSDFAVTDRGGDFTEHAVWGVDFGGDLWLLDYWYGQTAPDRWIEELCDLISRHKPLTWFGEAGPIRRSVEPFLRKRMDARGAYCNLEWLASINDKATRARAFQALASMGKVKIPKNKPWMARILSQWLQFPAGRLDDAVDAASLIGRGLEFTRNATRRGPLNYVNLAIP